jgi:hypothetical protein
MITNTGTIVCVRNGTDSLEQARKQNEIKKYGCPFTVFNTQEEIIYRIQKLAEIFQQNSPKIVYNNEDAIEIISS